MVLGETVVSVDSGGIPPVYADILMQEYCYISLGG